MKYCPKCGKKLGATDKFCDRCGADVSQVPAANAAQKNAQKIMPVKNNNRSVNNLRNKKTNKKLAKNRKIRNYCLIIAACVLLLAAGGMVFFTLQSGNNSPFAQSSNPEFTKTAKSLGFDKADDMSPSDTAGLAISFAHMHFKDDPDWNQAFNDAQNGDLHIRSVPEYQFGDYNVKAPEGGAVYVVSPSVGYVVSDVAHPAQAKITYVSHKSHSKPIFLPTLAKQVSHKSSRDDVQNLVKSLNVEKSDSVSDSDDDSDSNSSSSSSNDDDSDDEVSWDSDKEEKLSDFMDSFGEKMEQDYDEYDGDGSFDCRAHEYPDAFDSIKLYSDDDEDGDQIDIGWDPKLKKDYDYHCVAIFNCNQSGGEQHITYLFCIHDDQPIVLVDQSTNGDIKVKETDNDDVKNAFADILAGKDVDDDENDN